MFNVRLFAPRVLAMLVTGGLCLSMQAKASAAEKLSKDDQTYLTQATQEVLGEKGTAQLARSDAKHEDVKRFAEEQVKGAEKMEKELHEFADKHEYVLPSKDVFEKANDVRLQRVKSAPDFDKAFVDGEIRDHENMIDLFKKAADKVENTDLKAWFESKGKSLEDQLGTLKDLQAKLAK